MDLIEAMHINGGVIILEDGSDPTKTLEIDADQADFTGSGFGEADTNTTHEKIHSRGRLRAIIPTDPVYPTGSFSLILAAFTGSGGGEVIDFIRRKGAYATNKSTLGDGKPYTINIVYKFVGNDDAEHTWTFKDCLVTLDTFSEGRPSTVSFSFECLGGHERA